MIKQKALGRLFRNTGFFKFRFSLRSLLLAFAALIVLLVCCLRLLDFFIHVASPNDQNYSVVSQYASAAENFVKAKGSFPTHANELREFYIPPPWLEKRLNKPGSELVDFFGEKIIFSSEADRLLLGSLGKDGKVGGQGCNEDFVFTICRNVHDDVWVVKQK